MDCDAISFVIIAESMDYENKDKIRKFLLHFGTIMSSVTIPNVAIAANKNDSIFGARLLFTLVKLVLLKFFYFYCPFTGSFD